MSISKRSFTSFFCLCFFLSLGSTCYSGNLSLIEKRLRELDTLNKQTIRQATQLPENGVITATIKIPPGGNIKKQEIIKISLIAFEEHSPFTIQVGSSPQRDRVLEVAKNLRKNGISAFVSTPFFHQGKNWWRIFIGSYPTKMLAQKANATLLKRRFPKGFITNMPYTIQMGNEHPKQEAVMLELQIQKKFHLPYLSPGKRDGYFRILLGAFKTEIEGNKAIEKLSVTLQQMHPAIVLR